MIAMLALALTIAGQVRDGAKAPATGTSSISGVIVTDAQPATPVRRAIVVLHPDSGVARTTVSDDQGRYAFDRLPHGRYTVMASKPGWTRAAYGATRSGGPGRTIDLADGARVTASIRISRGAVITGTVVDQFGQPLRDIFVNVFRYAYAPTTGERRLSFIRHGGGDLDEHGAYRIYGLPAGDYYVSTGGGSGRLRPTDDLHLTSDVDVQAALSAPPLGAHDAARETPPRLVDFAQTYYPGTADSAQATPITLRAGEERDGVDFGVTYAPTSRVGGIVNDANGSVAGAAVSLINSDANATVGVSGMHMARTDSAGHFEFAGIAPGSYVLVARNAASRAAGAKVPGAVSAVANVDVQSEDIPGLSLSLQEGLSVSGTIRYDGAATPPSSDVNRPTLLSGQSSSVTVTTIGPTTMDAGRFTITGVTPGRYRISMPTPPRDAWMVQSISIGGRNITDLPVDINQTTNDVAIVLTDRKATLSGKVTSAGAPSGADRTALLFAQNGDYWIAPSRRILTTRVGSDGAFDFRAVPAGDYFFAVLDDLEPGQWYDPSFLQGLIPSATKVTIADGEQKVQDIHPGGG